MRNGSAISNYKSLFSPLSRLFTYQLLGGGYVGKLVYRNEEFIVTESRRGHVIINTNGIFSDNHGHVKKLSTCEMLIKLIHKEVVPDSDYLRKTALRISLNQKYKEKILNKIAKDGNRQYYFNPSKGMVRK